MLTAEEREKTRRWVAMLDAQRATLRDEVEADLEQYRHLSPEQLARLRSDVLEASWNMLQKMPNRQAVLDWRDPPAPDFEQVWARLVRQGRALKESRGRHPR